MAGSDKIL